MKFKNNQQVKTKDGITATKIFKYVIIAVVLYIIARFILTAVHEAGHALFLIIFGVPILGIFISAFGGETLVDSASFYSLPDISIFIVYIAGIGFEILFGYVVTQVSYAIEPKTSILKAVKVHLKSLTALAGWDAIWNSITFFGFYVGQDSGMTIGVNDMTALIFLMMSRGDYVLAVVSILVALFYIYIGGRFVLGAVKELRVAIGKRKRGEFSD